MYIATPVTSADCVADTASTFAHSTDKLHSLTKIAFGLAPFMFDSRFCLR